MNFVKMTDLFYYINDGTHDTPIYTETGIPFYSVEDVTSNFSCKSKFISNELSNKLNKRCKPEYGDILLTRIGTIGEVYMIDYNYQSSIYVSLALLKPNKNVETKYIYTYMKSGLFKRDIFSHSLQNATPIKINTQEIKNLSIPFVGNVEVRNTIVNIMESVDNAIESLKSKLSKINNLHNGYMNSLFHFDNNEVETHKLRELVGYIKTGKIDANQMTIDGQYRFYTCAKNYYYIDKYAFDGEALLISGNGANVGYVHHYIGKFNAYQRTYVLMNFHCNVLYLKAYLDYFLSKRISTEVRSGNTPYITLNTVTDMIINIPKDENIQKNIANYYQSYILEKEKLEKEITKYENIREGLLNGIFTGQIEVPENYEEV